MANEWAYVNNEGLAMDVSGPSSRNWGQIAQIGALAFGTAAKYYGGYLQAQNQLYAGEAESALMSSEAFLMDYNAMLAKFEERMAERERDIEIVIHRDEVSRTMGRQKATYAWGNIDISDPGGTPMQVALESRYNAEFNEGIIVERGFIKTAQARAKAAAYRFKASQIRMGIPQVMLGAEMSKTAALVNLSGEFLKDTGDLTNAGS